MNDYITDIYRIAGRDIQICSLYQEVHQYCREYRAPEARRLALQAGEQADLSVQITTQDIDYESAADQKLQHFSDSYREGLAVCRKISEYMPSCDTFLFHASAVAVDGRAYLFAAASGTGKSTHTRLWRELLGERAVTINDDKPFVGITPRKAVVYGSPWCGKHRLGANICVPLKAVCILERSEKNQICRISPGEAYPMLLQQVYRPKQPEMMKKTLQLIDRLTELTEFYRLGCNMDLDAARLSYETMKA